MLNFFKKNAALIWANQHVQKTNDFKQNAEKNQEKLLLSLVKTAEKTLFGREHRFEDIKTVEDFQKSVAVADYEDLKPYIEKVKEDNEIFCGQKPQNILPKLQAPHLDQNIFLFKRRNALSSCRSAECSISLYF